jgi:hypothetical protein
VFAVDRERWNKKHRKKSNAPTFSQTLEFCKSLIKKAGESINRWKNSLLCASVKNGLIKMELIAPTPNRVVGI